MSEFASPAQFEGSAERDEALTVEAASAALEAFRQWLASDPPAAPEPELEPVDLHTLVGQFTALRQEVNLQTRATRSQTEQLSEALAALRSTEQARPDPDAAVRPVLKTLIDVYDALNLAAREVERAPETLADALEVLTDLGTEPPPKVASPGGFWSRLSGDPAGPLREWALQQQEALDDVGLAAEQVIATLSSLRTGYSMGLQRVQRTLEQLGVSVLATVGEPFDPERMEAVEVVADTGEPAGTVVDEVRRGYMWRGQIFRYAQVRVAKD
jgi:molecular chaperone GrpE